MLQLSQGIPHLFEPKVFEILDVGGCETGGSVVAQGQGETKIEDPTAGEAGLGSKLPDPVHDRGVFGPDDGGDLQVFPNRFSRFHHGRVSKQVARSCPETCPKPADHR